MAVVEITLPRVGTAGVLYTEGPEGFFLPPDGYLDTPLGSGLYPPAEYLEGGSDGLYTIPADFISPTPVPTSNIANFSVQEDATPLDPSSSEGGAGTITVSVPEEGDSPLWVGGVLLADGSRGKTSGIIRSVQSTDGAATISADSVMSLFNSEKTILPYEGTFRGAVQHLCDLVGIPNDVLVDATLANRQVVYPGGRGNVWVRVKQMLAAEQVEMAMVFDRLYVRPLRLINADTSRLSTFGWTVANERAAKSVTVGYYNSRTGSQMEIYPLAEDPEPQVLVVDGGSVQVIEQQLSASLTSVNQPVAMYHVEDRTYEGTDGVYSITGADDLPIQPAQWKAAGGSLSVEITDDPSVIRITVFGADIPHLSPFRIAMSSGSSNYYNSLHITGRGVAWDKREVTIATGATSQTTSTEVGVVVDNPYIRTKSQAYSAGLHTAGAYSGVQYQISGEAFSLNRTGENRDLIQMTIADFNAEHAGDYIYDFNAQWAGKSIEDFNQAWQNKADLLWENQLFGNAPGARVYHNNAFFRVVNATTSETSVQFSATLDTTIEDFNAVWEGATIGDFNQEFIGYTCRDFSIVPLRRN